MRLRADRTVLALVPLDTVAWTPSPAPGVERRMLERDGGEVARATSVVRYAPGARFPRHVHDEGEEFLVLDGVFADEHGVYPAGTWVRNPPGTAHAPFTERGCTLFVKLRQTPDGVARDVVGPEVDALLDDPARGVSIRRERWDGEVLLDGAGHEVLVLSGALTADGVALPAWSWLRAPRGRSLGLRAHGAGVWHRRGPEGRPPPADEPPGLFDRAGVRSGREGPDRRTGLRGPGTRARGRTGGG